MIIELCGVPGAGKSTVAHALVTELRGRGHAASLPIEEVSPRRSRGDRLRRKLRRAAVEVAGHPQASARTVRAVMRSHQPTWRDVAVRSLNWLVLRAAMRRASTTPGFHVFDQGLVQELCSLGFAGDAASVIDIADPGVARRSPRISSSWSKPSSVSPTCVSRSDPGGRAGWRPPVLVAVASSSDRPSWSRRCSPRGRHASVTAWRRPCDASSTATDPSIRRHWWHHCTCCMAVRTTTRATRPIGKACCRRRQRHDRTSGSKRRHGLSAAKRHTTPT